MASSSISPAHPEAPTLPQPQPQPDPRPRPQPDQPLSTLSDWSIEHIKRIFENPSDEASECAIRETFADSLVATANGAPVPRAGIDRLVANMRASAVEAGLRVEWKNAEAFPRDPSTNRDGTLSGYYIIRGLRKKVAETGEEAEFERHKQVNVTIESQSSDPNIDSRRIVNLIFEASDVKADSQGE